MCGAIEGPEAVAGLDAALPRGEGAHPEEAFPSRPEARPGDGHYLQLCQHLLEAVPRAFAVHVHEYVRCVHSAVHLEAQLLEGLPEQTGVLQVVANERVDLLQARVVQAGQTATLHHVRGAVEGRGHHAVPVRTHLRAIREAQLRRHHSPAQPHTREAGVLGEGVDLDGHLLGAGDLVDGLGHVWGPDEGRVGRIEHDYGAFLFGELHETLQLLPVGDCTCGIVRRAEVVHVGPGQLGDVGEEVVGRVARHVHDVLELLGHRVDLTCLTHHNRRIDVHWIAWILHSTHNLRSKHHLQTRDIAFRPIANKNFFRINQVRI
mmetsp:Transcript_22797/g.31266  ORF Transcript_22797/g.31266 Transcript_22797/m.31266 type:complete len:319 (-) Transcript_22797:408-1364(-)